MITVPDEATGLTVVCEGPRRDRTFITYLGVNAGWDLDMISPDAFAAESFLLCDYFCAPALQGEAARELLGRRARSAGATTFFDTAGTRTAGPNPPERSFERSCAFVDVFLPNEAEARAITGISEAVDESARLLQSTREAGCVVKLGAQGCFAAGPGGGRISGRGPGGRGGRLDRGGRRLQRRPDRRPRRGKPWPEALRAATTFASAIVARPSGARQPQGVSPGQG